MTIYFEIEYAAFSGHGLVLVTSYGECIPLTSSDYTVWSVAINIPQEESVFRYHYQEVDSEGVVVREEWVRMLHEVDIQAVALCEAARDKDARQKIALQAITHREVAVPEIGVPETAIGIEPLNGLIGEPFCGTAVKYVIRDSWAERSVYQSLYSSAYEDIFMANVQCNESPTYDVWVESPMVVEVSARGLLPSQHLLITGSSPELGEWDVKCGLRLEKCGFGLFRVKVPCPDTVCGQCWEYKFVVIDTLSGRATSWEQGENRTLRLPSLSREHVLERGLKLRLPPQWRTTGVAIPVFSLRSQDSWGIGDFGDLSSMVDWVAQTSQRVLQILPINDTTITHTVSDSYPYNAISIYALHPLYLAPRQMGVLVSGQRMDYYTTRAEELNALPSLDYEAVDALKWSYFRELYAQEGLGALAQEGFKEFFEPNSHWLRPWAAFSVLRDRYSTADTTQWGDEGNFSDRLVDRVTELVSPYFTEISFYYWLQYHLHLQLSAASNHAHSRGVALMGDIPIGISRQSVEAWCEPSLFNLDMQAGAPPDDFATRGQNWGFPTYNWPRMGMDGYRWWLRRFGKMGDYFDCYRIDHILGFFRIWQLPIDSVRGLLGQFSPALPLSVDEIRGGWRFEFLDSQLIPCASMEALEAIFGPNLPQVASYLDLSADGLYRPIKELRTQRAVGEFFDTKFSSREITAENAEALKDGFMTLLEEVLFVVDATDSELLHPRITAQKSCRYQTLTDRQKERFDAMYNHFFYHRHNDFWAKSTLGRLSALVDSTRMLCCAEDLGMIPDCVPQVLDNLGILTLEIERMPKRSYSLPLGDTQAYPYRSVCTTSTHDMSALRGWWLENPQLTQRYWQQMLRQEGVAPREATARVCRLIIERQVASPSQLCILPLADWLSVSAQVRATDPQSERINIPSDPRHKWVYRMHLTIEELMGQRGLNETIAEIIKNSERQ